MRQVVIASRRSPGRWARRATWCVGLLAVDAPMREQTGVLRGVVVDSADRKAITDADIMAASLRQVARSNDKGQFTLTKLPKGDLELTVRRLGYKPQTQTITLSGGERDSVMIELVGQAELLHAMEIDEVERHRRQGIEDFYVRRARGVGTFITRQQLEDLRSIEPTDALRSVPGVQLKRTRNGGNTVRFTGTGAPSRRDCPPNLWLDGQRMNGMELDQISARDIEGIELYRGASTTPAQFWQGNSQTAFCGTIVVWSRVPGA